MLILISIELCSQLIIQYYLTFRVFPSDFRLVGSERRWQSERRPRELADGRRNDRGNFRGRFPFVTHLFDLSWSAVTIDRPYPNLDFSLSNFRHLRTEFRSVFSEMNYILHSTEIDIHEYIYYTTPIPSIPSFFNYTNDASQSDTRNACCRFTVHSRRFTELVAYISQTQISPVFTS